MNIIDQLVGKTVCSIGRASNMLCISMGDVIGKTKSGFDLTMYEIHCQCSWRLVDSEHNIILASSDIYSPPSNCEWEESFEWDNKGGNLFDEKIVDFNAKFFNMKIIKASICRCNDLLVVFDNNIIFESFNDSTTEENWRVLQRGSSSTHLVSIGNQLIHS